MRNRFHWLFGNKGRRFHGGIHPPEMKFLSNQLPIDVLPLPKQFIIPMKQHQGEAGECCVQIGDKVLRGQALTRGDGTMLPVHAPTSGTITAIGPKIAAHPSGLSELSITLLADGEDRWIDRHPIDFKNSRRAAVLDIIHHAGIAGLGGAGFPSAIKLSGACGNLDTLIINAAECEPYITADDCLMQAHADEILQGIEILSWLLCPKQILLGIEDNKPEALRALKKAFINQSSIEICVVPTKYPSGGSKQLTQLLTGKKVPRQGHSIDIGVIMLNVATVWAIKRAISHGEPLTERVVTLSGGAISHPRNFWVRLGTPVSHLLSDGTLLSSPQQKVIMGGPLMGFTLPSLDIPIIKTTNCLLAPSAEEWNGNNAEQPCIRCGACADVCPAELLPQQLYWFSRGRDHDKAQAYRLHDCIECGACAWLCPSAIPLVQYYRQEKAELNQIITESTRASEAKIRFNARKKRLEREKVERQTRHTQAMMNVAAKRQQTIKNQSVQMDVQPIAKENLTQVNDENNRWQDRPIETDLSLVTTQDQSTEQTKTNVISIQTETRKLAVAEAIARAKAKKASRKA